MKKLMTIAATLLISTSVFATTQTVHSDKNFSTDAFADKSAAYQAGFDYLDNLKGLKSSELEHKLLVISQTPVKDVTIDNSQVAIEEFAQNRGEVAYRAVINVDYHYSTLESNK